MPPKRTSWVAFNPTMTPHCNRMVELKAQNFGHIGLLGSWALGLLGIAFSLIDRIVSFISDFVVYPFSPPSPLYPSKFVNCSPNLRCPMWRDEGSIGSVTFVFPSSRSLAPPEIPQQTPPSPSPPPKSQTLSEKR